VMFVQDDRLPLSAQPYFLFCERQCALLYDEALCEANLHTADGCMRRDRVDSEFSESGVKVGLPFSKALRFQRLGLMGRTDVEDFHHGKNGRV
jgi:CRISPR-associated exonuclease Cas4